MGTEYYAICKETKKYVWLGRFYEWSGIDRREEYGEKPKAALTRECELRLSTETMEQVAVGYGYMYRLVQFMRQHEGRLVEVVDDNALYDIKGLEARSLQDLGWEELWPLK